MYELFYASIMETKGAPILYVIPTCFSGEPDVMENPAITQAWEVTNYSAVDMVHKRAIWDNFLFYLLLVVPIG